MHRRRCRAIATSSPRDPSSHISSYRASSSPLRVDCPFRPALQNQPAPLLRPLRLPQRPRARLPRTRSHIPRSDGGSRIAPDTLRCVNCSADLALAEQIISKGFTGRYGRGILVAPPPPPAEQGLLNIRVGRNEERQLVTGWHVVADISCSTCNRKLGWKYVDAKDPFQKYKIGKFILETDRVITHRSWEDVAVEDMGVIEEEEQGRRTTDYADIVFDSDDEEE